MEGHGGPGRETFVFFRSNKTKISPMRLRPARGLLRRQGSPVLPVQRAWSSFPSHCIPTYLCR